MSSTRSSRSFGPVTLRDRGVHAALEQGARLFFAGEHQQALTALDSEALADAPLQLHVHLLRAAALYHLFVRSGEKDQALRTQALAEIDACKRLDPDFRPTPTGLRDHDFSRSSRTRFPRSHHDSDPGRHGTRTPRKLGPARRKEFGVNGGTIGRLPDNDWVLPDPYVSSHHARIRFQGDTFYIEDTSTNGVFINSPDNRLTRGRPQAIQSGDCIFIEPVRNPRVYLAYAVHVEAEDPFGLQRRRRGKPDPSAGGARTVRRRSDGRWRRRSAQPAGPRTSGRHARRKCRRAADLERGSVMNDPYRPPAPVPPASEPFAAAERRGDPRRLRSVALGQPVLAGAQAARALPSAAAAPVR